jgi:dTDP-4-dehydrorhamnose reductase
MCYPMKNVAVIGSNGMLGYAVSEYFKSQGYPVYCLTRNDFDISKDDILKLGPLFVDVDVVINCSGIIKQRIDSYPIEEILKVNSIFPINLAKLCDKLNIQCFHITTDCVYSGKKGGYIESDFFDADDVYGMSKNAGDTDLCMTLRTSIIGEEKAHFKSLLSWVKSQKGKTINGYSDHIWNGVTTLYLAEIIENIIELNLYQKGVFHIHSQEVVSKYELTNMINEVYCLGITVNQFRTNAPCDRSLLSEKHLSSQLVKKDIKTQLIELKAFFDEIQSRV